MTKLIQIQRKIAVKADQIDYEPDHLNKLIKKNQNIIEMLGFLIKFLVKNRQAKFKACRPDKNFAWTWKAGKTCE